MGEQSDTGLTAGVSLSEIYVQQVESKRRDLGKFLQCIANGEYNPRMISRALLDFGHMKSAVEGTYDRFIEKAKYCRVINDVEVPYDENFRRDIGDLRQEFSQVYEAANAFKAKVDSYVQRQLMMPDAVIAVKQAGREELRVVGELKEKALEELVNPNNPLHNEMLSFANDIFHTTGTLLYALNPRARHKMAKFDSKDPNDGYIIEEEEVFL